MKLLTIIFLLTISQAFASYRLFDSDRDNLKVIMLAADTDDEMLFNDHISALAKELNKFEIPIYLLGDESLAKLLRESLPNPALAQTFNIDTASYGWLRDYGPTFLFDEEKQVWSLIGLFNSYSDTHPAYLNWSANKFQIPIIGQFSTNLESAEGNLITDKNGNCFVSGYNENVWVMNCKRVIKTPCLTRNCHIDEVLSIKHGKYLVSDPRAVKIFQQAGITPIISLPTNTDYISFANILYVRDHAFFYYTARDVEEMKEVSRVLESIKVKPHPILTNSYSGGGIHCMAKEVPALE